MALYDSSHPNISSINEDKQVKNVSYEMFAQSINHLNEYESYTSLLDPGLLLLLLVGVNGLILEIGPVSRGMLPFSRVGLLVVFKWTKHALSQETTSFSLN